MELETLCGFGCADSSPGSGSSRYRGFFLHTLIILDPLMYCQEKSVDFSFGGHVYSGHDETQATSGRKGLLR